MPETSGPPHRRVSSLGRTLAAAVLLDRTGRDLPTILAVIDGAAYHLDNQDTDGARLLLTLAADDPATAADALRALNTPAPAGRTPPPPPPPAAAPALPAQTAGSPAMHRPASPEAGLDGGGSRTGAA